MARSQTATVLCLMRLYMFAGDKPNQEEDVKPKEATKVAPVAPAVAAKKESECCL